MPTLQLILTSALISGLVSGFVSYIAAMRLKRLEFRFNHRKYIVDKRVSAYEKIEEFLSFCDSSGSYFLIDAWFENPKEDYEETLVALQDRLQSISNVNFWYSTDLFAEITMINMPLSVLRLQKEAGINLEDEDNGAENFRKSLTNLRLLYMRDISKLDDIENFMKEQPRPATYDAKPVHRGKKRWFKFR